MKEKKKHNERLYTAHGQKWYRASRRVSWSSLTYLLI